ncbi:uncharacterized protein LOC134300842 isoform X2 [Trichomycterus rosablanca]|uniref:uncharacterized protein LOC134300842 isoform X2 n=1 Tax=Trichomycterus rosablanca TaxID=2290929 RepID=UPI002F3589E9
MSGDPPSSSMLFYIERTWQKRDDLMKAQVDDLRNQLKAKDGIIQSLEEEMKTLWCLGAASGQNKLRGSRAESKRRRERIQTLRQDNSHLPAKLQSSREKVNSPGLEVGRLESKLQEETEQSQQLRDQILKQQEALSRANQTLRDARRAAGNKCIQSQKELEVQVREKSEEFHRVTSEKRKLELELATITEKHQTAQREVANHNEVIWQLKAELRVSAEKYQGAQEELGLQEAEVSRLNEKVKRQQVHLRQLSEACRHGDTQLDHERQTAHRLQNQLRLTEQQLKRQTERVQLLQEELTASRLGYNTDAERWAQRNLLLQNQIQHLQEQNVQHTQILPELEEKLKETQNAQRLAQHQVTEYEELLQKCDREIKLLNQQLEESQDELKKSRTLAQNHQSAVDIFKKKYMAAMEKVQQLQVQIQRREEEAQISSKQLEDLRADISNLKAELSCLESRYEQKVSELEHSEEVLEQLTEELHAALDTLRSRDETNLQCEKEMEKLQLTMDNQQKQISAYEEKCLQLQRELTSFQNAPSHWDEESRPLQNQHGVEKCTHKPSGSRGTVVQLRPEALGLVEELHCGSLDVDQQQKDNLNQLKQEVAHLEEDLTLARTSSLQKEQALQECEQEVIVVRAELQHTFLTLCVRTEEVQTLTEENKLNQQENQAVRNHINQLSHQLQLLLSIYTGPVDQKDKTYLLSNLTNTEDQLTDNLQQLTELQMMVEKLQLEADAVQKSLLKARDVVAEQQRLGSDLTAQRDEAREQLQRLKRTLEESLAENTHLQQERAQLATNISSWLKEHRAANESLARRIKQQNELLTTISLEKTHLQESRKTSQEDLKRLRAQLEDKDRKINELKMTSLREDNQTNKKLLEHGKEGTLLLLGFRTNQDSSTSSLSLEISDMEPGRTGQIGSCNKEFDQLQKRKEERPNLLMH